MQLWGRISHLQLFTFTKLFQRGTRKWVGWCETQQNPHSHPVLGSKAKHWLFNNVNSHRRLKILSKPEWTRSAFHLKRNSFRRPEITPVHIQSDRSDPNLTRQQSKSNLWHAMVFKWKRIFWLWLPPLSSIFYDTTNSFRTEITALEVKKSSFFILKCHTWF